MSRVFISIDCPCGTHFVDSSTVTDAIYYCDDCGTPVLIADRNGNIYMVGRKMIIPNKEVH